MYSSKFHKKIHNYKIIDRKNKCNKCNKLYSFYLSKCINKDNVICRNISIQLTKCKE